MGVKIALAGNPNCGKTTLFNALTGSNQFVGNWPGVTVEKKEGKLKFNTEATIVDLPGIYSLSPYTLEEVVARNYLIGERPDVILNIVDGSNLERNLYLTTQLIEIGIPVVVAINMMDIVRKNGDKINVEELSRQLGCKIFEISALKGEGIKEVSEAAIKASNEAKNSPNHSFSGEVEHAIAHIEDCLKDKVSEEQQRWFAIKVFERDPKVMEKIDLSGDVKEKIEKVISEVEDVLDDDAESIITNERYIYIAEILKSSYKKKQVGGLTTSDKIDKIVTNRFLALPIFAIIMYLVYYIAVTSVGTIVTDWANDGVFGEGWHLFGIGSGEYEQAMTEYAIENVYSDELVSIVSEASENEVIGASEILEAIEGEDFGAFEENYGLYASSLDEAGYEISEIVDSALEAEDVPQSDEYGIWIKGIPVYVEAFLDKINCADWLKSLVLDGIVGGVGAVLGFVPQMMVLFIFLAFLESCGYMARIAFIMDRLFKKFGLSGKSFIPMLIGTGCGVPGVMASRTIENDRDRRMTIITTTFIPCGAKLPIIALISTSLFGGEWWVAPSAYFVGILAIIISGIILKKTMLFAGDPAPFVMELPAYHMPTVSNVLRSMWERAWSFIKRAGTVILLASIIIWAGNSFGTYVLDGASKFGYISEASVEATSILDIIGKAICWIFAPIGFGNTTATVATIMGLVAKEEVVGVFGVLDFVALTKIAGYSFLIFNLLCAPCFAAIGAIKREMNNGKWTLFAISYQCGFAYAISLIIYQLGGFIIGEVSFGIGTIFAIIVLIALIYLLFRPNKVKNVKENKLSVDI